MKRISLLISIAAVIGVILTGCKKDEFLPPEYHYMVPETKLTQNLNVGAYYISRTTPNWAEAVKDHPTLNNEEMASTTGYISTSEGILSQQCLWADQAGVDFFIFPYNAAQADKDLISAFSHYKTQVNAKVKIVINYNFSHLSLNAEEGMLIGSGAKFELLVAEIKTLYTTLFNSDYYYHLPDGRPTIMISGLTDVKYDYSKFIPAFKAAMREYHEELQGINPELNAKAVDFYIIGEVAGNWLPPQRHGAAGQYLDANLCKQWYPSLYYERWYALYSYTDIAWENWRDYASRWRNDFIPCIYPEYYVTASGSRSVERSKEGYQQFCNVAKRNFGKNRVVIINSWNDFETASALEPADEWGEEYLNMTRSNFKVSE